ncbi:MAG: hypothetical protein LKJ21_00175 [Oscillospiraceae bacterium]|jgi:hypothetical protein|nr:hypothetical protein [Oscillospiraceae bacterium]MCI1989891.1 hypothetical protein [Oscillospiraceae bacterium]MCI2035064.1 hypothetical protein [Oscillospiraceae bacterium]
MPNRKDEEPIAVTQTLTEEDFSAAAAAVRYFAAPMRRRSVRAAACLTVAALAASTVPASLNFFGTAWVSAAVTAVAFAAAVAVWFWQPVRETRQAALWFRSCPLMALPSTVTVFRDRAVVESKCERITEYWTDLSVCVETDGLIAAAAGKERGLLIVKKQGLSEEEAARLSARFRGAFERRYFRFSGRKRGNSSGTGHG